MLGTFKIYSKYFFPIEPCGLWYIYSEDFYGDIFLFYAFFIAVVNIVMYEAFRGVTSTPFELYM